MLLPLFSALAYAHQQPTTLAVLDIGSDHVAMNLHVPLNELELAFGHEVTQRPQQTIAVWGPPFRQYLLDHIHPVTDAGQPWSVQVLEMSVADADQPQSGPFQAVLVHLSLTPPAGASLRNFILRYDVIMHQVVTHKALLSVHTDWAAGRVEPVQLGVIAVNTGTARIEPVAIHLGDGSLWVGFRGMVSLGIEHIREGTDHLLFLLVLLLPATLTLTGRRWGNFGGSHYSLLRLMKVVTAFTLGHSATLLAGALHWLRLPQQPVEVLIACSILVTAIHAIHPIFPGREAQIAAGFGLVHGLAFATVLADLNLPPGRMALSILGFNLGIELMQLFVIAVTVPWLILLSLTPAHKWVRMGGALLAAVAALGWIVNRVSGESNGIERLMTTVTRFSPLGILLLAFIAIPAYMYATFWGQANCLTERESNR
ncbi:MAG TPA: HupE/UreJ family protein [Bryobacteraceae bacterium]|nr:HupE/UreJ family protein [Bryobacteraceae bacterium]